MFHAELKIDEAWSVGDGANSKEVEVQKNRIRREREIVYRTIQEIPSNPREPWDREMECDDSLTLEIPIDQLPDVETLEALDNPPMQSNETMGPTPSESMMSEPDFELLAELLKNPELVFALTSGKAGNLSSDETVKLLDRIKAHGASSLGNLAGNANDKVEVSLPSPTPSSDPVPVRNFSTFCTQLGNICHFFKLSSNIQGLLLFFFLGLIMEGMNLGTRGDIQNFANSNLISHKYYTEEFASIETSE